MTIKPSRRDEPTAPDKVFRRFCLIWFERLARSVQIGGQSRSIDSKGIFGQARQPYVQMLSLYGRHIHVCRGHLRWWARNRAQSAINLFLARTGDFTLWPFHFVLIPFAAERVGDAPLPQVNQTQTKSNQKDTR